MPKAPRYKFVDDTYRPSRRFVLAKGRRPPFERPIPVPRRSARISDAVRRDGPSPVYLIPEIFLNVIRLLDWRTLMKVNLTSKHGQYCVQTEVFDRIRYVTKRWIDPADLRDFFAMLNDTGAVATGSIVRRIFSLHCAWYEQAVADVNLFGTDWSYDLNLVAPIGKLHEVKIYLQELGYDIWVTEDIASHFDGLVTRFERGFKSSQIGEVSSSATLLISSSSFNGRGSKLPFPRA